LIVEDIRVALENVAPDAGFFDDPPAIRSIQDRSDSGFNGSNKPVGHIRGRLVEIIGHSLCIFEKSVWMKA